MGKIQKQSVEKTIKLMYGIDLKPPMVDDIDEIYFQSRKDNLFKVAFYRLINFVLAIFGFAFFYFARETRFEKWIFLIWIGFFAVYNFFQCWSDLLYYKRMKRDNNEWNN